MIDSKRADAALGVESTRRRCVAALAAALVFCGLCGFAAQRLSFASLVQAQRAAATQALVSFSATVQALLVRHEVLPRILALDPRIVAALESSAAIDEANRHLEAVAVEGGLMAAYLIDADGLAIAASNWNQTATFVGQRYRFRPYFRDAMGGGFGRLYAVGTTTDEPGYFMAAPVRTRGRVVGVVVVKTPVQIPMSVLPLADEVTAIADEHGVLFLSSDPAFLYRTLAPLSAESAAVLSETKRYGRHRLTPLGAASKDGVRTVPDAAGQPRQMLEIGQEPGRQGWRTISFIDLRSTVLQARAAALGGAVLGALGVGLMLYADLRRKRLRELAASRERVERSEARLKAVADYLPDMVCFVDVNWRYVFANLAFAQMVERTPESLPGLAVGDVLPADDYAAVTPYLQRAFAGETVVFEREYGSQRAFRCFEATYRPEWDAARARVIGVHTVTRDVTATKRRLEDLTQLAQLDHLTQILNRKGFDARLSKALQPDGGSGRAIALLFIDLDGFKPVNDRFGHATGDQVLAAFAKRLVRSVREHDTVARLGGDEFAVILTGIADAAIADRAAAAIVRAAGTPFDIDGNRIEIGASVGISVEQPGQVGADAMCRSADDSLYRAKRAGGGAARRSRLEVQAG